MLKNKIKSSLAARGLTMRDLATQLGVTPGTLSNYLKNDMKMSTALSLAEALAHLTQVQLTLGDFK
jgi:transcriptional regulator with XRE-family HTH domain